MNNIIRFQLGIVAGIIMLNLRTALNVRDNWDVLPEFCKEHYIAIISLSFLLSIMTLLYIFEIRRNKK